METLFHGLRDFAVPVLPGHLDRCRLDVADQSVTSLMLHSLHYMTGTCV